MSPKPSLRAPQQQVGRYTIHDQIASGGMATVHLARFAGPLGFSRVVGSVVFWAMLATSSTTLAQSTSGPSSATVESVAVKTQFADAQKLYKSEQYGEALRMFLDLAETTRSPNARLYVGQCLQRLGMNVEAYHAFTTVVKDVNEHPEPRYVPTREAAIAQLAVLNVRLGKIVVSPTDVPPAATLRLDGAVLDPNDLGTSIVVQPGSHRVEVAAPGVAPLRREVTVDGGELKTVTFSIKKVDDALAVRTPTQRPQSSVPSDVAVNDGSAMRTTGLIIGGTGVAGLAIFTITGLMLRSTVHHLEAECPRGCTDEDHLGQVDRARTLQTTANVGLVVGLLGAGTGTTLFVLGQRKSGDNPVSLSLSNGGGTVSYGGRF